MRIGLKCSVSRTMTRNDLFGGGVAGLAPVGY